MLVQWKWRTVPGRDQLGRRRRSELRKATTGLAMTRVKHHSWSWVGVVVRGNGVRRRRRDVVIGAGVGSVWGIGVRIAWI